MGPPAFQAYRSARLVASCLRQSRASKPLSKNIAIAASQRASISSKPKPALPRSSTIPPAPAARVAPASKNANHGVIDPQAAIPEASTVADVDPTLAAEIPTSDSSSSGTPLSPAFAAALSGSGSGNGNGNGNGTGPNGQAIDWSSSFHGLSTTPFSPETAAVLMQALDPIDIEIKPDGIIYLPEIKYRRILNKAFGPGGWGLAPRGELIVGEKVVTREYALVVHGRFIAQARGECQYFSEETIPTAGEGCKSNALLRCCKDLGIASELWDPRFIRAFKKAHCHEIWVEHVATKKRRQIWVRKDSDPAYPYQAVRSTGARV